MSTRNIWLTALLVIQVVAVLAISSRGLVRRSDQLITGGLIVGSGVTTWAFYAEPRAARKDEGDNNISPNDSLRA